MGLKVLVVEDDPVVREILKTILKDHFVIEADNGEEAVKLYKYHKPDVVLMDIVLPDKDRIQATEEILKEDENAVIIGITAFAAAKKEAMLKAGAKEVIEKPLNRTKILEAIERYAKAK
ncbi:response regulator receiver protein [Ferroglobus placidus DSM 10642]|uniref:Response regulator receiver protein n=1 Tax=Ferroglobus placidus (strain DSM 10642 / AEDII12DO) TaxID=589924 RepID=D3RZF6_FERPA|nr:response regulator [Ferroglobus placidus]ADC65869.1 response regulator receiver protein [Ferroglobus placidus DSM 10642]